MIILKQNRNKVLDIILDNNPGLFEREDLTDELREFLTERNLVPVKGNYRKLMTQALQYVIAQNYNRSIEKFSIPSDFPKGIIFDFSQYTTEEECAYEETTEEQKSYFYDINDRLCDANLYTHRKKDFCALCNGCRLSKLFRIDKRKQEAMENIPF